MEKQYGYGVLEIKAMDEEKREIEGIASTISTDRDGDILIPEGAQIKTPFPFLYHHDRYQPIGEVYEASVTPKGIRIKARLVKVEAPSQLAARLEEAWVSIKTRLIRGISVGFRPLDRELNKETGGWIFKTWEMLEASAVTIPANQDATITAIKSLSESFRTDKGDGKEAKKPINKTSDFTEKTKKPVKLRKEEQKMSLTEKIKSYQAELKAKQEKIVKMAEEDGDATFDEAKQEEFDTLTEEVKSLEGHIERLKGAESAALKTAKAVTEKDGGDEKKGLEARQIHVQVKKVEEEKGLTFARYAMCLAAAKGDVNMALNMAKEHYSNQDKIITVLEAQSKGAKFEQIMKADVAAGTTLNSTWAAPLVNYQDFVGDFVEFLRPRTIIGQFGQGGIPSLNRIPFNVRIAAQTSGGSAAWVGEGAPKPLTKFDFDDVELRWAKIAAIAVLTEELIRFSNPSAERLVRQSLADTVIARMDTDFILPSKAAVSNVSPASITNGANTVASSGSDADAVRCDIQALWAFFIAANNAPRNAVYIMNSTTALAVSLMQNPLGQSEFPGLTLNGGTFMGVPVIVSDYVPEGVVVLVNASDIWLADDGQVTIDASREASLQMLDNPTNNSATPTPTTHVSMFQTNSVAIRAERYINWARRRASGVAYLTGVTWGACPTSV